MVCGSLRPGVVSAARTCPTSRGQRRRRHGRTAAGPGGWRGRSAACAGAADRRARHLRLAPRLLDPGAGRRQVRGHPARGVYERHPARCLLDRQHLVRRRLHRPAPSGAPRLRGAGPRRDRLVGVVELRAGHLRPRPAPAVPRRRRPAGRVDLAALDGQRLQRRHPRPAPWRPRRRPAGVGHGGKSGLRHAARLDRLHRRRTGQRPALRLLAVRRRRRGQSCRHDRVGAGARHRAPGVADRPAGDAGGRTALARLDGTGRPRRRRLPRGLQAGRRGARHGHRRDDGLRRLAPRP